MDDPVFRNGFSAGLLVGSYCVLFAVGVLWTAIRLFLYHWLKRKGSSKSRRSCTDDKTWRG